MFWFWLNNVILYQKHIRNTWASCARAYPVHVQCFAGNSQWVGLDFADCWSRVCWIEGYIQVEWFSERNLDIEMASTDDRLILYVKVNFEVFPSSFWGLKNSGTNIIRSHVCRLPQSTASPLANACSVIVSWWWFLWKESPVQLSLSS